MMLDLSLVSLLLPDPLFFKHLIVFEALETPELFIFDISKVWGFKISLTVSMGN